MWYPEEVFCYKKQIKIYIYIEYEQLSRIPKQISTKFDNNHSEVLKKKVHKNYKH